MVYTGVPPPPYYASYGQPAYYGSPHPPYYGPPAPYSAMEWGAGGGPQPQPLYPYPVAYQQAVSQQQTAAQEPPPQRGAASSSDATAGTTGPTEATQLIQSSAVTVLHLNEMIPDTRKFYLPSNELEIKPDDDEEALLAKLVYKEDYGRKKKKKKKKKKRRRGGAKSSPMEGEEGVVDGDVSPGTIKNEEDVGDSSSDGEEDVERGGEDVERGEEGPVLVKTSGDDGTKRDKGAGSSTDAGQESALLGKHVSSSTSVEVREDGNNANRKDEEKSGRGNANNSPPDGLAWTPTLRR